MKIFFIISIILSIFPRSLSVETKLKTWYARILDENVCLYKSPVDDISNNTYFILEPTYFVRLIENANSNFYKVQYRDITGYVKKNEVKVILSTPQTPFLEHVNFRIFSQISQFMRSSPTTSEGSSSQVYFLPYYSQDADYYGKIYGESAVVDRTNIWYFCKYTADKEYFGYIYSDGVDKMTKYDKNYEICEYVASPDFSATDKQETPNLKISPNTNKFRILIIIVSIPAIIFVFMIFKSNIILKLQKKERVKEVKPFFDSHIR